MMDFLVTIVIPAYNVSDYIEETVSSVLVQSYKNLEVVLVDDGATDETPRLCDSLAKKDNRIRVIHKENGGLSDARNCGIKCARGDYVIFLDGDDFWDDDEALERLVNRIKETNPDVLNYSYKKYYSKEKQVPYFVDVSEMPNSCGSLEEQLDYLRRNALYIASACNKMIRRSVLGDELLFQKGVFSEDIVWCAKLLAAAKSQDFICENFYCYRQRDDSITHTVTREKCRNLCDNVVNAIKICEDNMDNTALLAYAAYQYGTFVMTQVNCNEFPQEEVKILSGYRWILRYHGENAKIRILYILGSFLGMRGLCKIARILFGKRNRNV